MKAILAGLITTIDPELAAVIGDMPDDFVAALRALPVADEAALHAAIRAAFRDVYGRETIAPLVNRIGLMLRTAAAVS